MQRLALIEQRLERFLDADVQLWRSRVDDARPDSRLALKRIRRWLGLQNKVTVRQAQVDHSVTHAGDSVFALAVKAGGIAGVGIDFEPWRVLDQRHQRLMLTAREAATLGQASARDLLRIWTVKEACFKADVNGQQRWVTSYALDHPARKSGTAQVRNGRRLHRFRYISMEVPGGMLSVAFKMGESSHE